ncbi:hypothetical protein ACHAWC_008087 [Mediolabrus comicus]
MKTRTNNKSKVLDDEHQDSSHYEHNNDIHHLDDKEAIRQELLGKVCFSSSATVQKQNKKEGSSSSRVDDGATDVTRQQRVCQSKHSQRRAAKWRLQQA